MEIIFVSDKYQLIEKYQLAETWHQFLAKDVNQAPIAQSTSFQTAEIVTMEGYNTHKYKNTHTPKHMETVLYAWVTSLQ